MQKLQDNLAQWLSRGTKPWLAFTEMPLGSVFKDPRVQRADVLAVNFSYNTRFRIYECKQSRADFNADVNRGKYEGYLKYCHQLFFAVPKGLVTKDEVPDDCGLITFSSDKGWHTVMSPRFRHFVPTVELLLACLFRKQEMHLENRRLQERITLDENVALHNQAKNLGLRIRNRIANVESAWAQIEDVKKIMEEMTGEGYRDMDQARWGVQRWLDKRVPGIENIDTAADLVTLARDLVLSPNGSLAEHGAFKRLEDLILSQKKEPDGQEAL